MGSRRGTAALAIAAGLAAPGSLASASQTADPKLVVDPITSTFYLDSKHRGEDRSGSSPQAQASSGGSALVLRPSHAGLVLGLGSGVAYGSRLFFGGSGSKFLGRRQRDEVEEGTRAKAAAKAAAAAAKKEHAKRPEEEAAADGASGLPFMKVGGAMFVGIAASLALRRALRSAPARTAVAARTAVVTEVNKVEPAMEPAMETKRSPRRSSEPHVRAVSADRTSCSDYSEMLVSRNDSAEDLSKEDRAPNAEEISAAVGRLPLPPLGVDPKMLREKDGPSPRRFTIGTPYEHKAMSPKTQQFNIGTPPARDFSSPVELNHYDEPQPELEPGQEQKVDDRLQPGNKGYVHKRKSEYDAKAEVEKAEAAGKASAASRTLQRRSMDARRTEFHRIMTDPHNDLGNEAFQHPNEIGNDYEADLSSFNSTLSQRELDAAGNTNTSFFRIHTEG